MPVVLPFHRRSANRADDRPRIFKCKRRVVIEEIADSELSVEGRTEHLDYFGGCRSGWDAAGGKPGRKGPGGTSDDTGERRQQCDEQPRAAAYRHASSDERG